MTSELKQLLENIKRDALRVRDLADYKCPDPHLAALWGPMDRIVGVVTKALNVGDEDTSVRNLPHNGGVYQDDDVAYMTELAKEAENGFKAVRGRWFWDQARLIRGTLDRLAAAERTLKAIGYTHTKGAESWKPPLGRVRPAMRSLAAALNVFIDAVEIDFPDDGATDDPETH